MSGTWKSEYVEMLHRHCNRDTGYETCYTLKIITGQNDYNTVLE